VSLGNFINPKTKWIDRADIIKAALHIQNLSDYPDLWKKPEVYMWKGQQFQGDSTGPMSTSQPNLGGIWNDAIQSFKVYGGAVIWFMNDNYTNAMDHGLPLEGGGVGLYEFSSRRVFSSAIVFSLYGQSRTIV
jgi:hypothetical protein